MPTRSGPRTARWTCRARRSRTSASSAPSRRTSGRACPPPPPPRGGPPAARGRLVPRRAGRASPGGRAAGALGGAAGRRAGGDLRGGSGGPRGGPGGRLMRPSPARVVAHRVVRRVFEEDAFADRAFRGEAAQLEPRERALAMRLAYGTIQRKGTLQWIAGRLAKGKLEPGVRAALWLGLYQLLYSEIPDHAAIAESVELAKPSQGHRVVNAVLRRVQREGIELPADDTPEGAAIRHSHPEWVVKLWWDWIGPDSTRALLAADNEPAEHSLRVNTLVADDFPGRRDPQLPEARILEGPLDVFAKPDWAAGAVMAQSRGSMHVARAVDPQPGERVLDLCAAPGGKTTHLAALMGNEGEIVAVERPPGRADALRRTAARMGATIVDVRTADAEERQAGVFD